MGGSDQWGNITSVPSWMLALLALEETVGNNQFINFKTKQGLLFAMYLEFITFMMKFSYEA